MSWEPDEFQEMVAKVVLLLEKENFYKLNRVDDRFKFLEFLEQRLYDANDNTRLTVILLDCLDDYRDWQFNKIVDDLSEQGLIQMVIDEDGSLAYRATEEGKDVSEIIKSMLGDGSDNKFF